MQPITILCIGKLKEKYWRDACEEYIKRLGGPSHAKVVELDEERLQENPSQAQIDACLRAESKKILAHITTGATVVALCIEGKEVSSEQLTEQMNKWAVGGSNRVIFIIGSSFGLAQEVKNKADFCLSISPMTFPHQLARVMILEQIYRASQIEKGGKYHK